MFNGWISLRVEDPKLVAAWEPRVLPEFIAKARRKYGDDFKQLYFDCGESLKGKLHDAVWDIRDEDRLKIYISGHGGTGIQYITADDQVRKQTVDDLARLLVFALSTTRATSPQNSKNTEVNMVSCLFGRTPIGGMEQCPAARLHQELGRRHVYVDLVARTQSIVVASPEWAQHSREPRTGSRTTVSVVEDEIQELIRRRPPHAQQLKNPFSKIRCTYRGTAPVVRYPRTCS